MGCIYHPNYPIFSTKKTGRKSNPAHIRAKFSDFLPVTDLEAKTFVSIQKFFLS